MPPSLIARTTHLLKYHLHILLYAYFGVGLFVCGLLAPEERVRALGSGFITQGWHLSVLSVVLVLPVPVVYCLRLRRPEPGSKERQP